MVCILLSCSASPYILHSGTWISSSTCTGMFHLQSINTLTPVQSNTSCNRTKNKLCAWRHNMPRPSPPPRRVPPSRRNVAVLSHAKYVPTLTPATALCVKALLSKAAWWPWPFDLESVVKPQANKQTITIDQYCWFVNIFLRLHEVMNSQYCADVPLSNYSLTRSLIRGQAYLKTSLTKLLISGESG